MHSNVDRSAYQFALLNLAIIQADFECFSEAISAVQEAVAIARESHDMNCLNFCMSWLYHFGKAFPEQMREVQNSGMLGNEKEGLAFLKAKSKETDMWSLLSTTLVSEAKLEMQQVCFYLGLRSHTGTCSLTHPRVKVSRLLLNALCELLMSI